MRKIEGKVRKHEGWFKGDTKKMCTTVKKRRKGESTDSKK